MSNLPLEKIGRSPHMAMAWVDMQVQCQIKDLETFSCEVAVQCPQTEALNVHKAACSNTADGDQSSFCLAFFHRRSLHWQDLPGLICIMVVVMDNGYMAKNIVSVSNPRYLMVKQYESGWSQHICMQMAQDLDTHGSWFPLGTSPFVLKMVLSMATSQSSRWL